MIIIISLLIKVSCRKHRIIKLIISLYLRKKVEIFLDSFPIVNNKGNENIIYLKKNFYYKYKNAIKTYYKYYKYKKIQKVIKH